MGEAFAVFGAITGAVGLAMAIKTFCEGLTGDEGNDRLILQIQEDQAILQSFTEIFETVAERTDMTDIEKQRLEGICRALKPLLESLIQWIQLKSEMQRDGQAKSSKMFLKVQSALWKNADTRKLAEELRTWTGRYHIRLSLLPSNLRDRLLQGQMKQGRELVAISNLRSAFSDMGFKYNSERDLRKDESMLQADSQHARVCGFLENQHVVIEYKPYANVSRNTELEQLLTAVDRLALVLHVADANLCGIMKCIGYVHQPGKSRFALCYEIPLSTCSSSSGGSASCSLTTLLDLIRATRPSAMNPSKRELVSAQHPLNERFELARKLACAVLYVQAMGWVHKSIRTSNILLLEKPERGKGVTSTFPKSLGIPFLCGFDTARQDKAASYQRGDAFWEMNVYRHPARQGLLPNERYSMNHDIYSLGVVLLELGIWRPLLVLGTIRELKSAEPERVKDYFIKLAIDVLPVTMGSKYCDVVKFCLEIDGETAVTPNTAIDQVLAKLEEMSFGLR